MSYDVYLERDLCSRCRNLPSIEDFDWNYTSNVAPMWRIAMPETDGLAGLHGMLASEALAILSLGLSRMEADPDTYRALDPPNKWGSFDGQYEALHGLKQLFERNPEARVRISR